MPYCPLTAQAHYKQYREACHPHKRLENRKNRYLLGGKATSKTAAAVNLRIIQGVRDQ